MHRLKVLARRFAEEESGATAIEYGLLISLIFLSISVSLRNFSEEILAFYDAIVAAWA